MRPKVSFLVLGLLSLSCSNSLAPPATLAGTWAADYHLPGSSLVLDLSQTDATITGSGTYAGEAGPSGTLQVTGSYARPHVNLALQYDVGLTQTYVGTVVDSQHMTGTIADSTGYSGTLTFIRR